MDFFDRQDLARRNTGRLVVLFGLAVIAIVIAVNAAAFGILRVSEQVQASRRYSVIDRPAHPMSQRKEVYLAITLGTLGIVACGSLYKMATLARGGPAVAQLMGA